MKTSLSSGLLQEQARPDGWRTAALGSSSAHPSLLFNSPLTPPVRRAGGRWKILVENSGGNSSEPAGRGVRAARAGAPLQPSFPPAAPRLTLTPPCTSAHERCCRRGPQNRRSPVATALCLPLKHSSRLADKLWKNSYKPSIEGNRS